VVDADLEGIVAKRLTDAYQPGARPVGQDPLSLQPIGTGRRRLRRRRQARFDEAGRSAAAL
jgi:hypothetical protein